MFYMELWRSTRNFMHLSKPVKLYTTKEVNFILCNFFFKQLVFRDGGGAVENTDCDK